jgi:hypothetical protein
MKHLTRALAPIIAALLFSVLTTSTSSAVAAEQLPDLKMRPPSNFYIQNTTTEKRLRFQTIIWNAGVGKFEVRGSRPNTLTSRMTIKQRVYRTDGTYRSIDVPNTYGFYAGDGHDHWHVFKLQEFTIRPLNADGTSGPVAGRGAKTGFCFYDNVKWNLTLPGAPQSASYTNCGTKSSLSVREGLSVGWGDRYSASTAYQWIKINGLKDGNYRIQVIADPGNRFLESTETNNTSSTYIRISGNTVTLLADQSPR